MIDSITVLPIKAFLDFALKREKGKWNKKKLALTEHQKYYDMINSRLHLKQQKKMLLTENTLKPKSVHRYIERVSLLSTKRLRIILFS